MIETIWKDEFFSDKEALRIAGELITPSQLSTESKNQVYKNFKAEVNEIIPDDSPTEKFTFIGVTKVMRLMNDFFGPQGFKFLELSRSIDNVMDLDLFFKVRGVLIIPDLDIVVIDEGVQSLTEGGLIDGVYDANLKHPDLDSAVNLSPDGILTMFKSARSDCIKRLCIHIGVGSQFLEDPLMKLPRSQREKPGKQKPKAEKPEPVSEEDKVEKVRRDVANIEISRLTKNIGLSNKDLKVAVRDILGLDTDATVVRTRLSLDQLETVITGLQEIESKKSQEQTS